MGVDRYPRSKRVTSLRMTRPQDVIP